MNIEQRFTAIETAVTTNTAALARDTALLVALAIAHNATTGNVSLCQKALKLAPKLKDVLTSAVPHEVVDGKFGKKVGDLPPASTAIAGVIADEGLAITMVTSMAAAIKKAQSEAKKAEKAAANEAAGPLFAKLSDECKALVTALLNEGVAITKILAAVEKL